MTPPSVRRSESWQTVLIGGFFIFCGSAVAQQMDRQALDEWRFQRRTATFLKTEALIVQSDVVTSQDGSSTRYELRVTYSYNVNGNPYTGTRYGITDPSKPKLISQELPIGKRVEAFYDPADPQIALLDRESTRRGIEDLLFASLILLPLNLSVVLVWFLGIRWFVHWLNPSRHGIQMLQDGATTRLRLPHDSPIVRAAIITTLVLWGMVVVLAMLIAIVGTPWILAPVFALLPLLTIKLSRRRRAKIAAGQYDIILDNLKDTVSVPPVDRSREPITLNRSELSGVTFELERRVGTEGEEDSAYVISLQCHDGRQIPLHEYKHAPNAQAGCAFLEKLLKPMPRS